MKKYIIEAIFVAIALTAGLRLGAGDGFIYAFWTIVGYFFVSKRFPAFPVLISFFATNWFLKEEIDNAVPKDSFTADVFSLVYVGYMYFFAFAIAIGVLVVVLMTLQSMYRTYSGKKRKKAMEALSVKNEVEKNTTSESTEAAEK